MFNCFLSAPSVVAGCTEPMPDRPPLAPYTDGLGENLGGSAASEAPKGVHSLTHIEFGKFLDRDRELKLQFDFIHDYFLSSLRGKVIFASDNSVSFWRLDRRFRALLSYMCV